MFMKLKNLFKKDFDFVGIGDITTDAFIRLKNATTPEIDGEKKLCFNFADKIPYEFVKIIPAVGNSANACVSASRLGLKSAFVGNIGDDDNGKECLDAMNKNGVDTRFVETHKGEKTNYHYVLWFNADRTILVKHTKFPYKLPDIKKPKWIYLSSLAENSLPYHREIAKFLQENKEVNLAFQPGTFQMSLGYDSLKEIYRLSKVFFCNVSEAKRILNGITGYDYKKTDIKTLLSNMRDLGPEIVVITDGPDGAYTYDGKKYLYMPIYPDPKPPLERTGAGDSFSSTFTCALALGLSIEEALKWGPINSMSVVQNVGAQEGLLERKDLEEFLKNAPENYYPREI